MSERDREQTRRLGVRWEEPQGAEGRKSARHRAAALKQDTTPPGGLTFAANFGQMSSTLGHKGHLK
jgi:hypothetical protein